MANDQESKNGEILGRVIPRGAEKRRPPPAGTEFRDVTDTNGNTYKIIMSPYVRIGAPEEEVNFDLYIFQRVETQVDGEVSATFKKLRYQYDVKQIGDGQLKSGGGNFTNDGHARLVLKLPEKPTQTYLQLRVTVHQDGVLQGISTIPFIFIARTVIPQVKPAKNMSGIRKGVKIGARNTGTQYRIIGGKEVPVKPSEQPDEETTQEFEIPVVMQNPIRTPAKPVVTPDQEPQPAEDPKTEHKPPEHRKEERDMPEENQPQEPKQEDLIASQVLQPEKPKKKYSPLRTLLALLALIAIVVVLCFASLGIWQLATSPDGMIAPERVDCRSSQITKENGGYVLKACTPTWKQ